MSCELTRKNIESDIFEINCIVKPIKLNKVSKKMLRVKIIHKREFVILMAMDEIYM